MKPQFILIDPSIEGSGGHYQEYATRVLRAAKEQGFRTVLAGNRRMGELTNSNIDVLDRSFTNTYWENERQPYATQMEGIVRRSVELIGSRRGIKQFASECRAMLQRVNANERDLVFIPTVGGVELLAIALYSRLRQSIKLDWHMLFRRDLPLNASRANAKAQLRITRTKLAFREFKKRFRKGTVQFYTDTNILTARYNQLGVFSFSTLPIPIDESLGMKKRYKFPLNVSFLGDAREEKGFYVLPRIVEAVRKAGFGEDSVKFYIQVNMPASGVSKRTLRAQNMLFKQQGKGLEVLVGPFDSDLYYGLILNSDIMLLPYIAKSYQARSSGIFTEALAAGIPTLYPKKSWMGDSGVSDSGSLGFESIDDIPQALISLLSNYPKRQLRSEQYSGLWRSMHSASRLVENLLHSTADRDGRIT